MSKFEILDEYKDYKNKKGLVRSFDSDKKSIFRFISLKLFSKKYSEKLYKMFGITEDVKQIEALFYLGEKKVKNALKDKDINAEKFNKLVSGDEKICVSKDVQNYILKNVRYGILFNRATGLNISDIECFSVVSTTDIMEKSMLDILDEQNITKEKIKDVYDKYVDEILDEYMQDIELKNDTTLTFKDGILGMGGLQDHTKALSKEELNKIMLDLFNNENLKDFERNVSVGITHKITELIGVYNFDNLMKNPNYIKKEISTGIFNDISVKGKKYTTSQKEERVTLYNVWDQDTFEKKDNLDILRKRLLDELECKKITPDLTKKIKENVNIIDSISSKSIDKIKENADLYKDKLDELYLDYEIMSRENIIESIYDPSLDNNEIITDNLSEPLLLHFFQVDKKPIPLNKYLEDVKKKICDRNGVSIEYFDKIKGAKEELESAKKMYEIESNNYITNETVSSEAIGQVGTFDKRYVVDNSNQLSCMCVDSKDLLDQRIIRGKVALGFSKKTLSPDLIATISDKNIHSNKNINYVESKNNFSDFSSSLKELVNDDRKQENNEIVMFRNTEEATLKPSYIMYIGHDKLDSPKESEQLELIKKTLKESGINAPLKIFDGYTIRQKEKNVENKDINQR